MKTIAYLDAFSGIAGDMLVGCLVDAGADGSAIADAIHSLDVGAVTRFEKVKRRGLTGTKFHVDVTDTKKHRHLPHILAMIEKANMSATAKQNAARVFQRLGEAEAAAHGIAIEKVHFHEVGAADSIADILGACIGFELIGATEIYCSPINVGSGTVQTEHGLLPVPAPATAKLLEGAPVYAAGPAVELTTPTGAAIVTALAQGFGAMPALTVRATGYGAGTKDFPMMANLLRVTIGHASGAKEATTIAVIEANIDDASPQVLGYASERLFAAGALDVTMQPVEMKKGRPGTLLSVLAKPEDREAITAIVFAETTTLGVRMYLAERRVQPREFVLVETIYGPVRIKVSGDGSGAPEYEDCRTLALEKQVPLKTVMSEATFTYLKNRR